MQTSWVSLSLYEFFRESAAVEVSGLIASCVACCFLKTATAIQLVPKYKSVSNTTDGPEHDAIVQLSITLAVANVYGTAEDDMQEAHAFLSQQRVAEQVRF